MTRLHEVNSFEFDTFKLYFDKIFNNSYSFIDSNIAYNFVKSWGKPNITPTIYSLPIQYNVSLFSATAFFKILIILFFLFWPYLLKFRKNFNSYLFAFIYTISVFLLLMGGFVEFVRFFIVQIFIIIYVYNIKYINLS